MQIVCGTIYLVLFGHQNQLTRHIFSPDHDRKWIAERFDKQGGGERGLRRGDLVSMSGLYDLGFDPRSAQAPLPCQARSKVDKIREVIPLVEVRSKG